MPIIASRAGTAASGFGFTFGSLQVGVGYVVEQSFTAGGSIIEKYDLRTETRSVTGQSLGTSGYSTNSGCANSGNSGAGYFGGRTISSNFLTQSAVIDKFSFSNETRTVLSATLSVARTEATAMANSGTAGYFAGGTDFGSGTLYSNTDKLSFANDTTSAITGTSTARRAMGGAGNKSVAGYVLGGYRDGETTFATIDKYSFSNDVRSTLGSGLSAGSLGGPTFSDNGTAAYHPIGRIISGGNTYPTTIDKLAYATDTRTTISATTSTARSTGVSIGNKGVIACFVGGYNGTANVTSIDKLSIPSETRSTFSASRPNTNGVIGAASNEVGL